MLLQQENDILQTLENTKQETITSLNMTEYWRNTIEFISSLKDVEREERTKFLSFPTSNIRREKARVAKRIINVDTGKPERHVMVDNLKSVGEMIKDIKPFSVETGYTGSDNNCVKLIKGILPSFYESRVAYIRLRDLPQEIDRDRNIFLVREVDSNDEPILSYYCTCLNPFFTTQNLSYYFDMFRKVDRIDAIQLKKYHCVTFKVCIYNDGENGIIKSWDVGLSKESELVFNDMDKFVMLGQPR